MDSTKFFDEIKVNLFHGHLTQVQVDNINGILSELLKKNITDVRWIAYILATVYHETASTMRPIEEYGKGAGYRYGKKIKRSGLPYTTPDQIYYGRGFIQLTWYENYQLFGRLLNIDLLNQPDLALQVDIATEILIEGMTKGDFTGKYLEIYFNDKITDWVNARKIVNGLDKAVLIAGYGKTFFSALS